MEISSTVLSALIAALVSVASAMISHRITANRLKQEFLLQNQAEGVAKKLLQHRQWPKRSFSKIKLRLGGFDDDELRRILVRAGAVRFVSPATGEEFWGLLRRNRKYLDDDDLPGATRARFSSAGPH